MGTTKKDEDSTLAGWLDRYTKQFANPISETQRALTDQFKASAALPRLRLSESIAGIQAAAKSALLEQARSPLADAVGRIRDASRTALLTQARSPLAQALAEIQDSHRRWQKQMGMASATGIESLLRAVESVRLQPRIVEAYQGAINRDWSQWAEEFKALPKRLRKALTALAHAGWFLDPEMSVPSIWRLECALEDGQLDAAERSLSKHFSKRAPAILEALVQRHPARGRILRSAFAAHAQGQYELSVPVLLAQADGIFRGKLRRDLYSAKGKPVTELLRTLADDSIRAAMLHPLAEDLPLKAQPQKRKNLGEHLNRHAVLHGESDDYDTEINGLKAISLINFVSYALFEDRGGEAGDEAAETVDPD